jgi:GT2 family glycosyltransferase
MNNKVYIILLNYNGWEDTIECLESILKSDYSNYQIIVIDNDSPNNSMEYILNWVEGKQEVLYDENSQLKHLSQPHEPKPLEYVYYTKDEALEGGGREKKSRLDNPIIMIQAGENGGFAAGNNIGIKYALAKDDFEYVWLLNNDTVIEKNTLSKFVDSFENISRKENLGILGSVQYYYHNPESIQAAAGGFNKHRGNFWNYDTLEFKENEVSYVYGASMFIKKEVLQKVGLLNEEYFMYYEEIDYAERLKEFEFTQQVDKTLKVYHKHGGTTTTLDSDFRIYYLEKNKIIFYKKFYPFLIFVPILKIFKSYFLSNFRNVYLKALKGGLK